jgi:rRNA biogenesis protein RRP5
LGNSRIILTLKKTLVNTQETLITSFESATVGTKTPGSIIAFKPRGAIVEYFGGVRGFLPVAEMSEAYIKDPKDNFRLGQSVATRVLSVDHEQRRLIVSCRTSTSSEEEAAQFSSLQEATVVKASIMEKTANGVVVTIAPHGVKGVIPIGLLADASNRQVFKGLKVGDEIEAVALTKDERKRIVTLTSKESMLKAAKKGKLPKSLNDFVVNEKLNGYVKNATLSGLFICFAGNFTALAPRLELSASKTIDDPSKAFEVHQSVECYVISVDSSKSRVVLSLKGKKINTADGNLVPGDTAEATVISIKGTQLNVEIGKQQGRVDVSQLFDSIADIKDVKNPLSTFAKDDKLEVRVVGYHDARHHQFLPISHRTASHIVLELSARKADLSADFKPITLEDTKIGSKWVAYVNNISSNCVFVNLSPTVRGRISLLELSDDYELLRNVSESYPIGCAIECVVTGIDTKSNFLILSARQLAGQKVSSLHDLSVGQFLPALFIKSYPTNVVLSIGDDMVASCHVTDISDEYVEDFSPQLALLDVLKVKVVSIDIPNNKVNVTLRHSVLFGSSHVKDKYIESVDDVKTNDVVRGYVKNVASGGLFVSLGRSVTARVQIKELSDQFLTDWQKYFHVGQLVKGKVLSVVNGKIEFSLRESIVTGKSLEIGNLHDLKEGDILDGTVKRVEDFGVFVRLGNTNLSGLCHRSRVADVPVSDISKIFAEGDKVKVKILSVDTEKRRIALGMKASYFINDSEEEDEDGAEEDEISGEELDLDGEEDDEDIEMGLDASEESGQEEKVFEDDEEDGIGAGGFDWTANILDQMKDQSDESEDDIDTEDIGRARKRRKRSKVVEDKTATLATRLPQSVADYERLLVGSPNSSILWMNFMAFQLQLSEVEKAREIGKRALKTISFREETERLNIWIALLNLENSFGTDETLDEVFKDAVQYADAKTVYLKLVHIYIQSEKSSKAEDLYRTIAKKFGDDPRIWVSYATFMMDHKPDSARTLLDRALSALSQRDHREVITKFSQLEYAKGEVERGRTLFEGLISSYPRRTDLWIVYIDCEIKHKEYKNVESLFERVIKIKLSMKQAKFFFKKWLSFETQNGDGKSSDYVKAKAAEYVASRATEENE